MLRMPKCTKRQLSIKEGDAVLVTNDSGLIIPSKARSDPWKLGHGQWVIKVEGVSGGYALNRIQPAEK